MSDKIVNLTELVAVRAKMTHGKYENDGSLKRDVWSGSLFVAGADRQADADGIVATHNAADVLIEVASSLLRYNAAKTAAAETRWEYSHGNADEKWEAVEAADANLVKARDAHRAALAKVSL